VTRRGKSSILLFCLNQLVVAERYKADGAFRSDLQSGGRWRVDNQGERDVKNQLAYTAAFVLFAGLSACGGGGDSGSSTPPAATTFPLSAAYQTYVQLSATTNYNISGSCTGTGTLSKGASQAATFEGTTGYSVTATFTLNFTNCTPTSLASTSITYYNASYSPLGDVIPNTQYDVYLPPAIVLPTSAKVGDTAAVATVNVYTDSTKTVQTGTETLSFVIEADGTATSTAIVNVISKRYNTSNSLLSTQQTRFRISASGALSPVSIDVQYSTTSTIHLLYTAV
jgi:hypothetical protein